MKLGVPATSSSTSSTKTRQKVQSTLKVCGRRVKVDRVQNGAQERTRTSTPLRELAPEASASANSATWAIRATKRGSTILTRPPWFVNEARRRTVLLTCIPPITTVSLEAKVVAQPRTDGGHHHGKCPRNA